MAESSRHNLYYVEESTFGTTPTSPSFSYLRHTSDGLTTTKTEIVSAELYQDRGIRDARHGNRTGAGEVAVELSYNSFNDMVEAALCGTWSTGSATVTATDISALASDNSINSVAAEFGVFAVGDVIEISGFTGETANNGTAVVVTASTTKLTLTGITLTDDTAGESVTVTEMDKLTTGTTRRSFSVLRDFADLTAGRYGLFTGQEVNTASFSLGLDAIITGSIGFMGKSGSSSASGPAGATYGTAATTQPLTPHQGAMYEGSVQDCITTAMDWNISNGLEGKAVLCDEEIIGHGINRSEVTGNITAYFDDDTLLNKFLNETVSNLINTFTDAAGNKFGWFFPKVKYNSGDNPVGGEANTPISLGFRALHDADVHNASVVIFKLDA